MGTNINAYNDCLDIFEKAVVENNNHSGGVYIEGLTKKGCDSLYFRLLRFRAAWVASVEDEELKHRYSAFSIRREKADEDYRLTVIEQKNLVSIKSTITGKKV